MKYLTIILSLIFAFTFLGMDSLNQSEVDAQDKTETTDTDKKSCDKKKCCKHWCDKDGKKCEDCGKCECKCECKKECKRESDHKCGEGKCGEGKCGGDTKE